MQWRNAPGGYLREVLTAKVYDVAVETPLHKAEQLRWVGGWGGGWGSRVQHPRAFFHSESAPRLCCPHSLRRAEALCRQAALPWSPAGCPPPHRLPCVAPPPPLRVFSESLGSTLLLKREDLQPVKSFKLRGAYNKMAQLTAEQVGGRRTTGNNVLVANQISLAAGRAAGDGGAGGLEIALRAWRGGRHTSAVQPP